ncbi:hypothetical protein EDD85DRAFT_92618 [Armillaria nabsnona]|nr:hypothetical protein EDD85DRAFT_92618 [Armillaria nabsnona]
MALLRRPNLPLKSSAKTFNQTDTVKKQLRYPAPDEIMHVVDINKHQIGMWHGDMADSRQYQFAFIDSDSCPIPVPLGVHIYGVPRPDGDGTAHEVLSACGAETADVRSEVFVAPEGAVYRVTGLGGGCSFFPQMVIVERRKDTGSPARPCTSLSLDRHQLCSKMTRSHETPPKGMKGFWMESDPRGAQGKSDSFPYAGICSTRRRFCIAFYGVGVVELR